MAAIVRESYDNSRHNAQQSCGEMLKLIRRLAWRHLPKWLAWRLTIWRAWDRPWPQNEFDWYNYALLGVPPLRREITLRHWSGEDDAEIAQRFGISISEVVWHYGMANGHIEAIWNAKQRREHDRRYLEVAERIVGEATVH